MAAPPLLRKSERGRVGVLEEGFIFVLVILCFFVCCFWLWRRKGNRGEDRKRNDGNNKNSNKGRVCACVRKGLFLF